MARAPHTEQAIAIACGSSVIWIAMLLIVLVLGASSFFFSKLRPALGQSPARAVAPGAEPHCLVNITRPRAAGGNLCRGRPTSLAKAALPAFCICAFWRAGALSLSPRAAVRSYFKCSPVPAPVSGHRCRSHAAPASSWEWHDMVQRRLASKKSRTEAAISSYST